MQIQNQESSKSGDGVSTWRAARVRLGGQVRRWCHQLRAARHLITSTLLVLTGGLGLVWGGWLVGRWCLGLTLMLEAGGLLTWGLLRDDQPHRRAPQAGEKTLEDVLREANWRN